MHMKRNQSVPCLYLMLSALFVLLVNVGSAQSIHPLEPIERHYKSQAALGNQPVDKESALDTITFPWNEYGKGALSNALWRTVYLLPEDEARLSGLIHYP